MSIMDQKKRTFDDDDVVNKFREGVGSKLPSMGGSILSFSKFSCC